MSTKIISAISAIMAEVGHIGKSRKNAQQGYNFRGVDDVYAGLQLVMAKHGVICVPEVLEDRTEDRTTAKGSALIYRVLKIRYTFYADDGSSVTAVVIGEGMDSGDKASNKAMSVAHKYALLQVFMIPTDEPKDPENESQELKPKDDPEFDKRVKIMTEAFAAHGVGVAYIEEFIGKPLKEINNADLDKLRPMLVKIREEWAKSKVEKTNG